MSKVNRKEEKELARINELRTSLKDVIQEDYEDSNLRKWLKARNFDVDKAAKMFRDLVLRSLYLEERQYRENSVSYAYKAMMKTDTLLTEYSPPEVLQKYLTGGFCGHDKEGSPVRVELYGYLDMKGIMASVRKSDLEKAKLFQCEWTIKEWEKQSIKLSRPVDGLTVIFDMEGVTTRMLWPPGFQMYLHLAKVLEDNYPEMLKRLFVINTPRIFPFLYKCARPLISDEMRNKIHVISDKADYARILLKYIDPEELPACYGGTRTDPDGNPRCCDLINQGGDVPESFFLDVNQLLNEHMKMANVPRGDKFMVDFEVVTPGSILRWEFKTEDYDMGFGVNFTCDGETTAVIPVKRVDCHLLAEDGCLTCEQPGIYSLCFDNTFSWTRSKKVYYEGEIITVDIDYFNLEIKDLVEAGQWKSLEEKFETTHL